MKVETVTINNYTNINNLSPQTSEYKKDDIWCWKSRSWLAADTKSFLFRRHVCLWTVSFSELAI